MKLFVYAFRESDEREIFDELAAKYGFTYGTCAAYPSVENAHLAQGYDAITFTPCTFAKEQIDAFHAVGVRYIAARSIGFNHIDIPYAHARGMGVSHVDYPPDTVADYTVMLMLMGCRKAAYILERARLQDYSLAGKLGCDIGDLTVGIIGAGRIGKSVLRDLSGFGCRLCYCNRSPSVEADRYAERVDLDELLARSDFVSLHLELNADTKHIIGDDAFSKMKKGTILVNTARGPLVDTAALIRALDSGRIGYAVLDVFEDEFGLCYNDCKNMDLEKRWFGILKKRPDVLLTHHMAFYYTNAVRDMVYNCLYGMKMFGEGKEVPLRLA